MKTFNAYFEFSPGKQLEIKGDEEKIQSIFFVNQFDRNKNPSTNEEGQPSIMRKCIEEIKEYFSGTRKVFTIPYELNGTDFQKRVWKELEKIPYGETISYLELAKRLGDEKVIRAAASANGKNKIGIIIPCHRG